MPQGICALCQRNAELQDSHLIPKGVYKALREPDHVIRHPVLVTSSATVQTSEQVSDYLLCRACELVFEQGGEDWVLRNSPKRGGRFPLRDALLRSSVKSEIPSAIICKAPHDPAFDVERLIYFAASVFWRASVHHWSGSKHLMTPAQLSPFVEEQLRRFLLGVGPFPPGTALLISVSAGPHPRPHCVFPTPMQRANPNVPDISAVAFCIPGLQFRFMWDKVPEKSQSVSVTRPPHAVLLTDRLEDEIFDDASRLRLTSKVVGSLGGVNF